MSKFTLIQDSSQITAFYECAQRWHNYYNKRLEPIHATTQDEAMNAGTYGHKLLDIYYRMKFRGLSLNDTIEAVFAYNPDTDICECGCAKEFHIALSIAPEVESCKKCNKCLHFRPHPFELPNKVRSTVRKRFREYVFNYQHEDIIPLSEQHVEVGFSEPIYEDSENLFILEGRIDLIGKLQGLDCIMDHKFQTKTHWLYPKSVQLKNYLLISKQPMAVINYVRLQEKIQPDTLAREVVTLNKVELEVWHKRLIQIFFKIKKTMLSASNNGHEVDRTWSACSGNRLTYDKDRPQFCWYRNLCEEPNLQIAERREREFFKIKEHAWKPW